MALRLGIGTVVALACAAALWALPIGSSFGQPGVNLKLVRGGLSVTAPSVRAVPGQSTKVTVTVTDARGTGAGWTLKLASARPVGVLRVTAICAAGSTCTLPAASSVGVSPTVLHASPSSGMGIMQLIVTLAPLRSGSAVPVAFSVG